MELPLGSREDFGKVGDFSLISEPFWRNIFLSELFVLCASFNVYPIDLFCHQNWFYFKQEHFEGSIKSLFTFLSAEKTSRTSAFCPEPNFVGPCVGWVCLVFFFPLSFVPSRELKNK